MRTEDLDYQYPERLVATERAARSRVMLVENDQPSELEGGIDELLEHFKPGDCLVINETQVLRRRVFSESGLEILFLNALSATDWEVLCPSTRWKDGQTQVLPGGVTLEILARGRPQRVRADRPLTEDWFQAHGDLPLPPYIQKARGERRNRKEDEREYQTAWAKHAGSLAAPTASLHFNNDHLKTLQARGVNVARLTLHVGIGTFLPVTVSNLEDHVMHAESAEIGPDAWRTIEATRAGGGRIWAMGTTVVRTLESAAHGKLNPDPRAPGGFFGETDLFIKPGFEWRMVDVLLTNFHQPQSTLLALVASFAGLESVKRCYAWAIEREFRLFSYGDLSVWIADQRTSNQGNS